MTRKGASGRSSAAGYALVALVVSIIVSIKVGRSIVGRLRRLRGEALEMATERLPNVVRRLQRVIPKILAAWTWLPWVCRSTAVKVWRSITASISAYRFCVPAAMRSWTWAGEPTISRLRFCSMRWRSASR